MLITSRKMWHSKLTKLMKKKLLTTIFITLFLVGGVIVSKVHEVSPTIVSAQTQNTDWPQFQHDAQRTGRTIPTVTVGTRLRARWIWFGSNWILRNRDTKPGVATLDDDLASYEGHNLEMPTTVPFTFAETMQPIVINNKIFVGDHNQNKVWALNLDDGTTLWEKDNPGGTSWTGVATDTMVVFPSLFGFVTAWNSNTGDQLWQIDTGRTITSSPLLLGNTVYVGNHGGKVYAIDLATGNVKWQADTGAPIQGGLVTDGSKIFVATDEMFAYAFDLNGNQIAKSPRLIGQSFRGLWPLVVGNRGILRTVPAVAIGSEYFLDGVIDGTDANFAAEQAKLKTWLEGVGKNYQHLFALDTADLSLDYTLTNGPVGGVGNPGDVPVLTQQNQPVTWWSTYFGTFSGCAFGCRSGHEMDIATFDLTTGAPIQFPGRSDGQMVTSVESDNTFGMTVSGNNTIYMRQQFRGTKAASLTSLTGYWISAEYRYRDGGGWGAPLNYAQGNLSTFPPDAVRTPSSEERQLSGGHVGPVILPNRIIFTERFALTVMESY